MAKPRRSREADVEEAVARAKAATGAAELKKTLAHASARVVLAAASAVEEQQLSACGDALVDAFVRFAKGPAPDPQCRAKAALLRAIMALEATREREAYGLGRTCVQLEAQWGPPVDTAAEVRGLSVLGLVRSRHPDGAVFAAEALADPEVRTRLAAAHALAEAQPDAALPALRLKLAVGDAEAEVFGAAVRAFVELSTGAGLELARELLSTRGEAEQEAVLLALGESRKPDALAVLREYTGRATDVAFLAMALLRHEPATEHLLGVIESGTERHAGQAVKALANFRHDPALCVRVRKAAEGRSRELRAAVEKALST
ncbi:MAG: hypothetical protein JNK82_04335 [Myxococcaceae bacterium]|nr:hypothetical protein [Myxococcaceae bacterium]